MLRCVENADCHIFRFGMAALKTKAAQMANSFQKLLFAFSSLAPVIMVFSIIALEKGGSRCAALFAFIASVILFFVGGLVFLKVAKKRAETITFENQVESIEPDSQGISSLIGAYAIPLISLFAENTSFELFTIIVTVLTFILFLSNSVPPTIFLLLAGYRFYTISLSSGLSGVHLISKQKGIHSAKDFQRGCWLFKNDYWLLDKEGGIDV